LAWQGIASRFRFDAARFGSVRVLPLVDSLLIVALVLDVLSPFFVWRGILLDSVSLVSLAVVQEVDAGSRGQGVLLGSIGLCIGRVWQRSLRCSGLSQAYPVAWESQRLPWEGRDPNGGNAQ
jgi:hypothetical protein